jgi:hypothetical protein
MEKSNLHKYSRLQVFVKFVGGETGGHSGNTAGCRWAGAGVEAGGDAAGYRRIWRLQVAMQ